MCITGALVAFHHEVYTPERVHFPSRQYFEEEKVKRAFSGTHFLSKNMDFNNGNSLRMTEQEDISSSYFTIEET